MLEREAQDLLLALYMAARGKAEEPTEFGDFVLKLGPEKTAGVLHTLKEAGFLTDVTHSAASLTQSGLVRAQRIHEVRYQANPVSAVGRFLSEKRDALTSGFVGGVVAIAARELAVLAWAALSR